MPGTPAMSSCSSAGNRSSRGSESGSRRLPRYGRAPETEHSSATHDRGADTCARAAEWTGCASARGGRRSRMLRSCASDHGRWQAEREFDVGIEIIMMSSMRTTLTFDPDVEQLLQQEMRRTNTSRKAVVNDALRIGLGMLTASPPSASIRGGTLCFRLQARNRFRPAQSAG